MVHFPGYLGQAIFPGLPRTWVPVPAVRIIHEVRKGLHRTGIPLKLSWALTVHKCQGLNCPEGCVVNFQVSGGHRNPVSSPGLAFVAFTRVQTWERLAFQNLPAFGDFLQILASKQFQARAAFELEADRRHEVFLDEKHGITAEQEVQLHVEHCQRVALAAGRTVQPAEEADLRHMLQLRGTMPLPPEVLAAAQHLLGRARPPSLDEVARA